MDNNEPVRGLLMPDFFFADKSHLMEVPAEVEI